MQNRSIHGRLSAVALAIVMLAAGCASSGAPTSPDRTSTPTSVATSRPTATGSSSPTQSELPTSSPIPSASPSPTPVEIATPSPSPTGSLAPSTVRPNPTARPSVRPTPPPTLKPSVLVSHGSRSGDAIALTFDMGGRTVPAVAIMSWLRDHGVPATIFMTGASLATTTAARQVVAIVDARRDLFDLGNHSSSHPDMRAFTPAQVADELRRAEATIKAYADQSPRPLFRPPYGAWDQEVLAGAGSVGYRWTVMWDVDTIDWRPIADGGPTAQAIVTKVLTKAQAGSIVLMHLGGYETLAALPALVSGLQAKGYRFVTLGTMLGD